MNAHVCVHVPVCVFVCVCVRVDDNNNKCHANAPNPFMTIHM